MKSQGALFNAVCKAHAGTYWLKTSLFPVLSSSSVHQDKKEPLKEHSVTHTYPSASGHMLFSLLVVSNSFMTSWTIAHQAPLSVGFPRPEYWSGLPFPSPGDLSNQEWNPHLLHWQVDALPLIHQGSPASILTLKKKKDLWKTLNHISLCHPTWTTPWQYMNSSLTRKFIVKAAKIPLKLRE